MKVGMIFATTLNAIILLMMCYTMKFEDKLLVLISSLAEKSGMCVATGFYIMFDLQKVLIPELG